MRLSDQARRRLYLSIFVIFGPLFLLGTGLLVRYRTGSSSTRAEEKKLSDSLGLAVRLSQVEYQRPGQKRWLQLSLWKGEEPFLLAPEVLVHRQKTVADSLTLLLSNLDQRVDSEQSLPLANDYEGTGHRLEIPLLLLRRSQLGGVGAFLQNAIQNQSRSSHRVLWYARRILILEDESFFRWFNEGLPVAIPDSLPLQASPAGEITEANETKIIEQIQAFSAHSSLIEEVRGCWLANQGRSFFFASLNPARWLSSSAGTPLWLLTLAPRRDKTILFDSPLPFPVSLVRAFCPTLPEFHSESWMQGTIKIQSHQDHSSQGESAPRIELRHLTLARAPLETLIQPPLAFRGEIVRLTFHEGTILNGALIGKGSVILSQIQMAPEILTRLRPSLSLETQPENFLEQAHEPIFFDQMRWNFDLTHSGIRFSSSYPNGIIAAGNKEEKPRRMLFLSPEGGEIPYPALLNAFDRGDTPFWTPFYRKAINRLPVE